MIPDSEGLHEIANCNSAARRADIVFVHGLGGGSHSTWRHGTEGHPAHFFWPMALGRDLPDCAIWSLGHASGISHWFSDEGMALENLAKNFALKLKNNGVGGRPIIFITHSMGGLLVKEFVTAARALGSQEWARTANAVRGIVFLGTPHHGAQVATAAKGLAVLLRTQEHVKQMQFASSTLDQLHQRFMKWQADTNCSVESYVETRGIARSGWFGLKRLLPRVMVVPAISGNPNLTGCECHPIGADHVTLVKPTGPGHDVYAGVLRFIRDGLANGVRAQPSTAAAASVISVPVTPAVLMTPAAPAPAVVSAYDISRIDKYAPAELIGRESETQILNDAWDKAVKGESQRPHLLTFVALGGEGKTSLVAKWAADLAHRAWPGCEAVFAWSFYSQGTREQVAASSDLFLNDALAFFGDHEMAASARSAHDKGRRLAQLAGERRALLILDGVEPLQYAPTAPTPGELKDQGLAALLKGLAAVSRGLTVVTTRYAIPDLRNFQQTTAPLHELKRLSMPAGVALLQALGVKGNQNEFETLTEDVKGHALALNLLGSYLRDAHGGDIRKRDLIKLAEADAEEQGGHAFRVMDAYALAFEREGEKGQRALALLRLLGLFDRPADAGCLAALLKPPAIPALTEPLAGLSEAQRNLTLTRLESAKLLTVNRDKAGTLLSLDAHPLLREYFSVQLRQQQPEAWRAGHRRLYEHLCASTPDQPDTLEGLQPLYQAVAHGCQAGLQEEARAKVYRDRILRGTGHDGFYSTRKLGAFGSDLGAVACFFDSPWRHVSPALTEAYQAWLLNEAAFRLRALGRLTEALEPMRAGLEMGVKQENWQQAAISASNLSELELSLGEVAGAVTDAAQSVTYADRSGDAFWRMGTRTTHADALHHAGRRAEAEERFREAESLQAEDQPGYPLLYSLQGFRYCDLLLTAAERGAWLSLLGGKRDGAAQADHRTAAGAGGHAARNLHAAAAADVAACRAVAERAAQTLKIAERNSWLLDIALDHLTLGRAALYQALLECRSNRGTPAQTSASSPLLLSAEAQRALTAAATPLNAAVDGLRRSGQQDDLPRGLLTRAWLRSLTGATAIATHGPDSAQSDLDEAWEIAERGPMPLFMADIHLYRARLFFAVTPYPWESPRADLDKARALIEKHGYWRRKAELEDAEAAAHYW